jgi:putative ABC transport system ATP-binding protein
MKSIIKLKNVWKIYKMGEVDVVALRGVNLEIEKGKFLAILGPSGSGKSTMMNMIGSLDTPTKGDVYLDEINICTLSESDLAILRGKKIGFVFQTFNLISTLNAMENVTLPMIFQGVFKEERISKAKKILTRVGLSHRLTHRPSELSGGERQRVAIARALANDPEIILADEPTGNLDSKSGADIIKLLSELNKDDNKTVIMITHDKTIAKYADRIEYLKDGNIVGRLT